MTTIAFLDIIGLPYDGDTLKKRGLGGSESATILMAKNLAKLGFEVTIFNNCSKDPNLAKEGNYDGVQYLDNSILDYKSDFRFDVVISLRTIIPFLTPNMYSQFAQYNPQRYSAIKNYAKHKIVWMHDTFANGDIYLEDLLVGGHIDEVFTLSDFHSTYVTNCDHGRRRNFEVLKKKFFQTRNGIVTYKEDIDIRKKDPHLYVFNAAFTKGMKPLVEHIWPKIKAKIPEAKLICIGGFYVFPGQELDAQGQEWTKMSNDPKNKNLGIEFTGVIKQSEIADILERASFKLFPGAFPETFGISTLEALAYNTPVIATRFGALEETAVQEACYLIDYAIEPNNLFQFINQPHQVEKFVNAVLMSHHNRYLHQQKQYACNLIKGIVGWDSVALQWKQHILYKLGDYLSKEEYRKVSYINSRHRTVFGRRFTNEEENYLPRKKEQRIVIISPTYNSANYIENCIKSVVTQDYDNYLMIVIDDCSTDNTYSIAKQYESENIKVIRNEVNKGAVCNQIESIKKYCDKDDIVMFLDGDDSLVNNNQILHFYNNLYDGTTEFSYGSCWSMVDKIPLVAQPYPDEIKKQKKYREYKFNWNMPYTHLRTFKANLLDGVDDSNFQDENKKWYKAGGDGSIFYTLIEQCDPDKVKVVSDVVYNYNDINPLNDYKINSNEQTKNANRIITQ
jgi:glycosyltransferase involved in cell wall biosynthesis|tara:strand:- start:1710 stop:3740 length:2031 start_codon:yes stop_codon:yes gene_type:complete